MATERFEFNIADLELMPHASFRPVEVKTEEPKEAQESPVATEINPQNEDLELDLI
jgi:hypothetical protein